MTTMAMTAVMTTKSRKKSDSMVPPHSSVIDAICVSMSSCVW